MVRILFAFLLALVLLTGPKDEAQALRFHATMDPIRMEGQPGQIFTRHFNLTLANDEVRTQFKVHVEDWWRSEDSKQSFYREPGTLAHSCGLWTKMNPVEASVDPGGTLDVRVSVVIPGAAKPGGYWCALTVDEVPDPLKVQMQGTGVRFRTSLSVGIYVNVTPVRRAATITEVRMIHDEATVKLHNDGDCPLSVEGQFEFIRPGEKTPAAITKISRATLLTEPFNSAVMTAPLPDATTLPSGHYLVRAILDIGLTHYIGVQKEMEIHREAPPSTKADRK